LGGQALRDRRSAAEDIFDVAVTLADIHIRIHQGPVGGRVMKRFMKFEDNEDGTCGFTFLMEKGQPTETLLVTMSFDEMISAFQSMSPLMEDAAKEYQDKVVLIPNDAEGA
jgi:hypothetical protein